MAQLSQVRDGRLAGRWSAAVTLIAMAVHAAFMIASGGTRTYPAGRPIAFAAMLMPIIATMLGDAHAIRATLILGLLPAWYVLGGPLVWPFYLLVPVALWAIIVARMPMLRGRPSWLQRGHFDRVTVGLVVLAAASSGIALIAWFKLLHPRVEDELLQLPPVGGALLLAGGLGFALVNAALEECVWRGILQDSLESAGVGAPVAIGAQALSFGIMHVGGFPRGLMGVAMATVYGAFLGLVRERSRGLLAPFVAHVIADLVIFSLILTLIR
jgi:CAAX protease family protein